MSHDDTSSGLAEFLRSARARLSPQQAGLDEPGTGRRRVQGLRREELARLAGVSVDYYTRLEQGRNRSASTEVLDALPAAERNQARFVFLDPHARELYRDWPAVAADTAAMLRLDAGRHPEDPALSSLIGELSIHSEEFRHHWSANKVHQRTTGTKDYHHPLVGDLTVTYQALTPGDDPDQTLFVYSTASGSPSEAALRLLANWELAGWEQPAPADETTRADHGS